MKLYATAIAILLAATANAAAVPQPGAELVCFPPQFDCGTPLHPRCCDPPAKRDTEFVCPDGRVSCGTQLMPRCCLPCDPSQPDPPSCSCDIDGALRCKE